MIGVLVSGSGTNLQALIDAGLPIAGVASNVPGAHALERSRRAGIPVAVFELDAFPSREGRDLAMAGWLEKLDVRIVVCAGYMHILTPAFLARFPGAVLNVHPSLLPAFPGTHAVRDALAAGARETGVTVHLVDEGVDTGPVLAQERVAVLPDDTEETLLERLHAVEHRLLPLVARNLLGNRLQSHA
ncbi:MAG: phosphoribosylglycinamide formyltransferase [Thermoleophilia bacterium]|nr:phosphoribosylglycinamide formyltransferase [Thermoleophilia bacterium]